MTKLEDLPFVTRDSNGRLNVWDPDRSGTYEAQCALGRDYAFALRLYMQRTKDTAAFVQINRAIKEADHGFDGIEIGFYTMISYDMINPNLYLGETSEHPEHSRRDDAAVNLTKL